jgi:hypothetical protein
MHRQHPRGRLLRTTGACKIGAVAEQLIHDAAMWASHGLLVSCLQSNLIYCKRQTDLQLDQRSGFYATDLARAEALWSVEGSGHAEPCIPRVPPASGQFRHHAAKLTDRLPIGRTPVPQKRLPCTPATVAPQASCRPRIRWRSTLCPPWLPSPQPTPFPWNEMNRTHSVLFGMQNRTSGPYFAASSFSLAPTKRIGYTWSYLAGRIGRLVPILQPYIGSSSQQIVTYGEHRVHVDAKKGAGLTVSAVPPGQLVVRP